MGRLFSQMEIPRSPFIIIFGLVPLFLLSWGSDHCVRKTYHFSSLPHTEERRDHCRSRCPAVIMSRWDNLPMKKIVLRCPGPRVGLSLVDHGRWGHIFDPGLRVKISKFCPVLDLASGPASRHQAISWRHTPNNKNNGRSDMGWSRIYSVLFRPSNEYFVLRRPFNRPTVNSPN